MEIKQQKLTIRPYKSPKPFFSTSYGSLTQNYFSQDRILTVGDL